ncbi:hypothetical protein ACTXT7_003219 [Hymenolepis weldensis]
MRDCTWQWILIATLPLCASIIQTNFTHFRAEIPKPHPISRFAIHISTGPNSVATKSSQETARFEVFWSRLIVATVVMGSRYEFALFFLPGSGSWIHSVISVDTQQYHPKINSGLISAEYTKFQKAFLFNCLHKSGIISESRFYGRQLIDYKATMFLANMAIMPPSLSPSYL